MFYSGGKSNQAWAYLSFIYFFLKFGNVRGFFFFGVSLYFLNLSESYNEISCSVAGRKGFKAILRKIRHGQMTWDTALICRRQFAPNGPAESAANVFNLYIISPEHAWNECLVLGRLTAKEGIWVPHIFCLTLFNQLIVQCRASILEIPIFTQFQTDRFKYSKEYKIVRRISIKWWKNKLHQNMGKYAGYFISLQRKWSVDAGTDIWNESFGESPFYTSVKA